MKTIINIFFALIISMMLFACSIDKNTKYDAIRRIVNETEFDVRVEIFGDDERFDYNIVAYDSIDIQGYCEGPRYEFCMLGWSDLPNGRIYFGNEKVQTFEHSSGNDNEKFINKDPIYGRFGYVRSNKNGVDIYTYRITQEDYDTAEECDGECG
jgi:hypothetical protein